MLSIVNSSNLMGIEAILTKVEVDITNGIPCLNIVGLPSTEIRESRERVKSAIINSGFKFPNSRIVVNLSPADLKKEGSFFDLPIAIGVIREHIKKDDLYINSSLFVGELSLDGNLRKVRGILPIIMCAKNMGLKRVFIPYENIVEASFVEEIDVIPIKSLKQCIDFLNNEIIINQDEIIKNKNYESYYMNEGSYEEDFCEVAGNYFVKRSVEIAAAGNHNIFMIGPPGSGKTMIAKRLRTILPDINKDEMLEISKIYSAAGLIDKNKGIISSRPYRAPHHTTTKQSLIGGGYDARPGEVVLAHKGVLFLDEIAEFDRKLLETLRQPIEDKYITVSRVKHNFVYPCNVLLIGAMNPCPCGYSMSETDCKCSQHEIDRYINKISGPLLDRFDIFVEVNSIPYKDFNDQRCETSKVIKSRVENARKLQLKRFQENNIKTNDEMKLCHIKEYCKLEEDASTTLNLIYDKYKLSNRAYTKLMKVARTIADLELEEEINSNHIMEAFSFRKAYYNYFR